MANYRTIMNQEKDALSKKEQKKWKAYRKQEAKDSDYSEEGGSSMNPSKKAARKLKKFHKATGGRFDENPMTSPIPKETKFNREEWLKGK